MKLPYSCSGAAAVALSVVILSGYSQADTISPGLSLPGLESLLSPAPTGEISDRDTSSAAVAESVEIVAPALEELWRKGGETDFSPSAWEGRVGMTLDRWDGVNGDEVADLTSASVFYGTSNETKKQLSAALSRVQAASFPVWENGVRLRGLLVIPEDGEYEFALASDDGGELWMGTPGGSRFTKKKVLFLHGYTAEEDWSWYKTAPVAYRKGEVVWLEALNKNYSGDQHVSVAWKKPGDTSFSAIPGKLENGRIVLTAPPAEPDDPRDIGVPQEWLNAMGLGSADPMTSPEARLYGDTDGDGYNLLEEYQTGGRPDQRGGNRGGFESEKFANESQDSLDMFLKSPSFLNRLSGPALMKGDLAYTGGDGKIVQRVRTRIVPPMSGKWTFYVASDAQSALYLSTDETRFYKQEQASAPSYTGIGEWTKYTDQKSAPVMLTEGQPYFLELMHQQKNGNAHFSVGWKHEPLNWCRETGAVATQSSSYTESDGAEKSIDGDINTESHTKSEAMPNWWQVDLSLPRPIGRVVVYNRTDWWNQSRLSNFRIQVLDATGKEVAGQDFYTQAGTSAGDSVTWTLPQTVYGQVVKVKQLGLNAQGNYYLCLREVEVYEDHPLDREISVIGEQYIQTIPEEPNDKDNNSLPDDWQQAKGLVVGQNGLSELDCSEYGDPDMDMVSNRREYQLSTDPLVSNGAQQGYLTREVWQNIPGWSVDDSMKDAIVLGPPAFRILNKGAEAPRNYGETYHQRMRGTVTAPVTGDYIFWISSDETSVLYLSSDERKFHKKEIARVGYSAADKGVYYAGYDNWTTYPKQRSAPVHLEAGQKYFIEAQHKQYHSVDHLQIAWQMPGGEREIIPEECLASFERDMTDRDDDDLPDEWEKQYGIDPGDNGIVDFNNGAWGDPYGTGITNREAYLLGWDPRQPSLPDFGDTVVDIPAGGGTPVIGDWVPSGTGVMAPMGRGSISYGLSIPSNGRYMLEIKATPVGNVLGVETVEMEVTVDGQSLGQMTLRSLKGQTGRVLFLLPELKAGAHSFVVTMKNKDLRRSFTINSLRLIRPEGVSEDGCTLPQWLHDYLNESNTLTRCPVTSLTSPACVEGKSRALHLTRMTAGGRSVSLNPAAGTGWYGNVSLPEDGSEVSVTASFESGAHTLTSGIKWASCDMLTQGQLSVRKGDSLRVTVGPEDSAAPVKVTYTKAGEAPVVSDSNVPVVMKFTSGGVHAVTAAWDVPAEGGAAGETVRKSATMTVKVVDWELGAPKDLIVGLGRNLSLGVVPEGVLLQTDPPLKMSPLPGQNGETSMKFSAEKGGAWNMVARLGETGPIVDALAFVAHDNTNSSSLSRIEVVDTFSDGSSLVCIYLAADSLPEGGYIKLNILAAGVQFLEGGSEKIVRAQDFGPDGLLRIMMTSPSNTATSICHIMRYYNAQGEEL